MNYIGIDPGKKGGFAIISEDAVYCRSWDDADFIRYMKSVEGSSCIVCLEKVGPMPEQGLVSTFHFGESVGYIKGVLEVFRIPYQEIHPRKWKGEFGLNSEKAKSIAVCKRLFPDVSLLPTERCRVPSDGMAEALLMAEYARRKLG
jgi:crossover junction endodeoxyribonuclease RuvC